jgi:hypothetical protein
MSADSELNRANAQSAVREYFDIASRKRRGDRLMTAFLDICQASGIVASPDSPEPVPVILNDLLGSHEKYHRSRGRRSTFKEGSYLTLAAATPLILGNLAMVGDGTDERRVSDSHRAVVPVLMDIARIAENRRLVPARFGAGAVISAMETVALFAYIGGNLDAVRAVDDLSAGLDRVATDFQITRATYRSPSNL